jgi:enoyl-CoA hydratase/carnithine racemase
MKNDQYSDPIQFVESFQTLKIEIIKSKKILHVQLNRPKQLNALNETIFLEIGKLFTNLKIVTDKEDIRVIIFSGNGKAFSSGLDLTGEIPETIIQLKNEDRDIGRKAFTMYNLVSKLQEGISAMENCHIPIIGAIHGYCLGGALSLLVCTDIKLATKDSKFSIKEIDIGLTADLGFLQRIVKQTGKEGLIKKYSYTGEIFSGEDAFKLGFVEELLDDQEALLKRSFELAEKIAEKSPLVLWGLKRTINFARDNSVKNSLDMVATLNSALLLSEDIPTSIQAFMSKTKAMFPKL